MEENEHDYLPITLTLDDQSSNQAPNPLIDYGQIKEWLPSKLLQEAPSVLFIGFCSTGGGHTDREFNVVRAIIDRSFNLDPKTPEEVKSKANAQRCLTHNSVVVLVLPPDWPRSPGNYFENTHAFIQNLRNPKLQLRLLVVRGTKTATSVYEPQGGRPALLRLHARFPFENTKPISIPVDTLVGDQDKLYSALAPQIDHAITLPQPNRRDEVNRLFGTDFRDVACPKISMMDLVPGVVRAAQRVGEQPKDTLKRIWGSTDMDFALTRALHKAGVPWNQVADHESILNLFVENPYAGQQLLEYCYMGKVLPSKAELALNDPNQAVPDPADSTATRKLSFWSKTAHISLSTPDIEGMKQPNTLILLRSMVKALNDQAKGLYTQEWTGLQWRKNQGDGGGKLRSLIWNAIQDAGVQLSANQLAAATGSTGGFVYGADPHKTPLKGLKLEDIKGFVYLYLMDATNDVAKYIAAQLNKGNLAYQNIVFALCASGGIDISKLPQELNGIPQNHNVMMYCNLMGGDAVMQAGMGTSSEFAYSVVNGCTDSRLLVWPMGGQDEHASNARFVNALFPSKVTQIGKESFISALDTLVKLRNTKGRELKAYSASYVNAILSNYTIAETAADVLLDDKELSTQVEDALLNVSNPDLKSTYRLMKICVQMLDQLEGPDKPMPKGGTKTGDGDYPYQNFLKPGERFVIGLKRGVYHTFKDEHDAITFFSNVNQIATFLDINDVENFTKIYNETGIALKVIKALQPAESLVSQFAGYVLKDISDVVKTGV